MRVFISGIAGFLGSHLAEKFILDGHEVSGCDNLIGGSKENIPYGARFFEYDCRDFDANKEAIDADIVYHCAATAHEGLSVFSPAFITRNIYEASVSVFSAAIAGGVKRLVFCSSMARYGANPIPFTEDMEPRPQDPYGIAKVAAEQTLKCLCEVHGMEYVIAVPHNIIGPRQKYTDPYRNVASIMINRMKQGKHPIVYGDGEQVRCFSYIDDVLSCLTKMTDCPQGVYNIGPDEHWTKINELVEAINYVLGTHYRAEHIPDRPQEVRYATCSSDKAREVLGYKTETGLIDDLRKMAEHIDPKPFEYDYPIEILSERTPRTWTEKLM